MIVSWRIAKGRIAKGVRPSFLRAWGLVLLDALLLVAIFALLWSPFRSMTADWPNWATAAALFAIGFIPIQGVLITSALWAAKSRWDDQRETP